MLPWRPLLGLCSHKVNSNSELAIHMVRGAHSFTAIEYLEKTKEPHNTIVILIKVLANVRAHIFAHCISSTAAS